MSDRPVFANRLLPYLLVAPQLILTGMFFLWPSAQAIYQALLRTDPFGLRTRFVGLENFRSLIHDPHFMDAARLTILFSVVVIVASLAIGLLLAVMANKDILGARVYKTLILWPYALAPAVAAVLWLFLFQPQIGIITRALSGLGVRWNFVLDGRQALMLVIGASVWQRVAYNFIFFLAGLQAIPRSVVEAAMVDGASSRRVFWSIVFPLLSPTMFFLIIMNTVFAFVDTFGVIDALTKGGPARATQTLVYRIYTDGVVYYNVNRAAAQSVFLLALVVLFTALQFKYIERRVHYE